jgi:hypothetical protein
MTAIASLIEWLAGDKNSIGIFLEGRFVRTFRRGYEGLDVPFKVRAMGNRLAILFAPSAREN